MLTTKRCQRCNQEKWFNPEAAGYGRGCFRASNFTGNTCRDCILAHHKEHSARYKANRTKRIKQSAI